MTQPLPDFERLIGRIFLQSALLQEALTHSSYLNEIEQKGRDNERLEFLGDAIVDFLAGEMLYLHYPTADEGSLTQMRSALVRAESLAMLATDIQLGNYMRLGHGEEVTGGRTRVNILGDGFEAVVGAIYLDGGMEAARQFLVPRLARLLTVILEQDLHRDARSVLQERAQAALHVTPLYRVAQEVGQTHEREYVLEVTISDIVVGQGQATNKRIAAQLAARDALSRILSDGWPPALMGLSDPKPS